MRSFALWIGYRSIMRRLIVGIVVFHPPNAYQIIFKGIHISSRFPFISAMNAQRLLYSGCTGYLASIVDVSVK